MLENDYYTLTTITVLTYGVNIELYNAMYRNVKNQWISREEM